MSLNLLYSCREGWKNLRRAKLSSAVTVTTVALMLFLLGSVSLITVNVRHLVDTFRKKMTIEVFIDNSQTDEQIASLRFKLEQVVGVQKAVFISKDEALNQFKEEFGNDPMAVLGENPLPPSFQIALKPFYRTPGYAESIAKRIRQIEGVDEVVYQGQLFKVVDRWSRMVLLVDIGLVVIVLTITILLVANTLRLTLSAQSKNIHIMRLVGATTAFIRMPFLIQGILEGGLGGTIASVMLWLVFKGVLPRLSVVLEGFLPVAWSSVALGILLGLIGSVIGLKRFLRPETHILGRM